MEAYTVTKQSEFMHDIKTVWPGWDALSVLGKGSYGTVYSAVRHNGIIESHAAIKVISVPADKSELDSLRSEGLDMSMSRTYFKGIVDDFVSEIQTMDSLKGTQNIVNIEDFQVIEKTDTIGWDIYIRMELLTPFGKFLESKKITARDAIKLGMDICSALEICKQRSIIHRDIKPENIFINDFGHFKLGDFGIARKFENITGALSQKGTLNYMAPEIATGMSYDERVDIYSLGIVLYRLFNNNRLPFLNSKEQVLDPNARKLAVDRRMRGEQLPPPCNANEQMARIILKACAHDPNARYSSASEMKKALYDVLNSAASEKRAPESVTDIFGTADLDATTRVRKAAKTETASEPASLGSFGRVSRIKTKMKR